MVSYREDKATAAVLIEGVLKGMIGTKNRSSRHERTSAIENDGFSPLVASGDPHVPCWIRDPWLSGHTYLSRSSTTAWQSGFGVGADALHRRRHPQRPGAFPDLRSDAVWLDLRSRRLSGAGFHCRLSASPGAGDGETIRRRCCRRRARPARTPTEPLRRKNRHARVERCPTKGVRYAR